MHLADRGGETRVGQATEQPRRRTRGASRAKGFDKKDFDIAGEEQVTPRVVGRSLEFQRRTR